MSESRMIALFDKWERVWRDGQFNLVPDCVGETYTRHDENGTRTVSREVYVTEVAKIRAERPDIRVVVYDHAFQGDRAWFRFAFKRTDPKTGAPMSRPECSLTARNTASSSRLGLACSRPAHRGAMQSRRSIGPAPSPSSDWWVLQLPYRLS